MQYNSFLQSVSTFAIIPMRYSRASAAVIIAIEFIIVIFVVAGGAFLIASFALSLFVLASFTIAIVSVLMRKINTPCNCFGNSKKHVSYYECNEKCVLYALCGSWVYYYFAPYFCSNDPWIFGMGYDWCNCCSFCGFLYTNRACYKASDNTEVRIRRSVKGLKHGTVSRL